MGNPRAEIADLQDRPGSLNSRARSCSTAASHGLPGKETRNVFDPLGSRAWPSIR
jgi:hypothetical protein